MAEERVVLTAELKDQMSAPLATATKQVDGFTKSVETGAKKQGAAADRSTAQITGAVGKQGKAYGGLTGVFQKVLGDSSRLMSGLKSSLATGTNNVLTGVRKLGAKAGDALKTGMTAAGAVGGAALVAGFAMAVDTSNAQSLLSAKLGASPAETARLGKVSGQLYASGVGEGMDDINTALEASYKAFGRYGTMSDDELSKASTQALAVAKILGVDVTRATQVAGTMVRNELAGNATEAFDLITKGSQNAAAGMGGDLLDALDEYSTFFTSMGINGPEAMSMLAEASHGGVMQLDKVGDAIKEFGIRSTDMSTASAAGYEAIGKNQQDMANRILEGGPSARKAFGEITDGLLKIKDPAKRAQAAIALFGTPIEDMDVTMIPSFLESLSYAGQGMEDFGGSAQTAADSLNSGPGFEIEKFKRGALGSLSEFGAKAIPYVKPFFDWIEQSADWLAPAALGFGILAGVLWGVAAAMGVIATVGWPITLIVLGIAALVAGLIFAYNNIGWFKDGVDAAFKWIGEAARNVADWVVGAWNNVVSFWQTNVMPVLSFLGGVFAAVFDWIGRLVHNAVTIIVTVFQALTSFWATEVQPKIDILAAAFNIILGRAVDGVKPFIDGLVTGFQILVTFLGAQLKPKIDAIGEAFKWLGDLIRPVTDAIGQFANNPLGGIQDWMGIKKDGNGQGIMPPNSGGGVYAGNGVRFAGGGVLGGYAPGNDSILARLSPGESVLVPELTRAIGPQNIMAANAAASGGRKAGSGPSLTSGHSARGGGGQSLTVHAPISITVKADGNGNVDYAALQAAAAGAVNDIIETHNRRSY